MNEAAKRWRKVPASHYDGHMSHASVGQSQALNRIFADALNRWPPRKGLCVLGCATGNGFEHIPRDKLLRVVGVDINLGYLHLVRERHGARLPWMELHCRDVLRCDFPVGAFDHIHAGLLFEYTDPEALLQRIYPWLTPGGVLSVVLQLPSQSAGKVSDSPYPGVRILADAIRLVPPEEFIRMAEHDGFILESHELIPLPQAKEFAVIVLGAPG